MTDPLLSVAVAREHDVVLARQRARQVASALGFDITEQTRISTAVTGSPSTSETVPSAVTSSSETR